MCSLMGSDLSKPVANPLWEVGIGEILGAEQSESGLVEGGFEVLEGEGDCSG